MTDAIPVLRVARAIGLSALKMAFFTEIGREFVEKATFAFDKTALCELISYAAICAIRPHPEQAYGHQLPQGGLDLGGFEVQQALQLRRGDALSELFTVHPIHH